MTTPPATPDTARRYNLRSRESHSETPSAATPSQPPPASSLQTLRNRGATAGRTPRRYLLDRLGDAPSASEGGSDERGLRPRRSRRRRESGAPDNASNASTISRQHALQKKIPMRTSVHAPLSASVTAKDGNLTPTARRGRGASGAGTGSRESRMREPISGKYEMSGPYADEESFPLDGNEPVPKSADTSERVTRSRTRAANVGGEATSSVAVPSLQRTSPEREPRMLTRLRDSTSGVNASSAHPADRSPSDRPATRATPLSTRSKRRQSENLALENENSDNAGESGAESESHAHSARRPPDRSSTHVVSRRRKRPRAAENAAATNEGSLSEASSRSTAAKQQRGSRQSSKRARAGEHDSGILDEARPTVTASVEAKDAPRSLEEGRAGGADSQQDDAPCPSRALHFLEDVFAVEKSSGKLREDGKRLEKSGKPHEIPNWSEAEATAEAGRFRKKAKGGPFSLFVESFPNAEVGTAAHESQMQAAPVCCDGETNDLNGIASMGRTSSSAANASGRVVQAGDPARPAFVGEAPAPTTLQASSAPVDEIHTSVGVSGVKEPRETKMQLDTRCANECEAVAGKLSDSEAVNLSDQSSPPKKALSESSRAQKDVLPSAVGSSALDVRLHPCGDAQQLGCAAAVAGDIGPVDDTETRERPSSAMAPSREATLCSTLAGAVTGLPEKNTLHFAAMEHQSMSAMTKPENCDDRRGLKRIMSADMEVCEAEGSKLDLASTANNAACLRDQDSAGIDHGDETGDDFRVPKSSAVAAHKGEVARRGGDEPDLERGRAASCSYDATCKLNLSSAFPQDSASAGADPVKFQPSQLSPPCGADVGCSVSLRPSEFQSNRSGVITEDAVKYSGDPVREATVGAFELGKTARHGGRDTVQDPLRDSDTRDSLPSEGRRIERRGESRSALEDALVDKRSCPGLEMRKDSHPEEPALSNELGDDPVVDTRWRMKSSAGGIGEAAWGKSGNEAVDEHDVCVVAESRPDTERQSGDVVDGSLHEEISGDCVLDSSLRHEMVGETKPPDDAKPRAEREADVMKTSTAEGGATRGVDKNDISGVLNTFDLDEGVVVQEPEAQGATPSSRVVDADETRCVDGHVSVPPGSGMVDVGSDPMDVSARDEIDYALSVSHEESGNSTNGQSGSTASAGPSDVAEVEDSPELANSHPSVGRVDNGGIGAEGDEEDDSDEALEVIASDCDHESDGQEKEGANAIVVDGVGDMDAERQHSSSESAPAESDHGSGSPQEDSSCRSVDGSQGSGEGPEQNAESRSAFASRGRLAAKQPRIVLAPGPCLGVRSIDDPSAKSGESSSRDEDISGIAFAGDCVDKGGDKPVNIEGVAGSREAQSSADGDDVDASGGKDVDEGDMRVCPLSDTVAAGGTQARENSPSDVASSGDMNSGVENNTGEAEDDSHVIDDESDLEVVGADHYTARNGSSPDDAPTAASPGPLNSDARDGPAEHRAAGVNAASCIRDPPSLPVAISQPVLGHTEDPVLSEGDVRPLGELGAQDLTASAKAAQLFTLVCEKAEETVTAPPDPQPVSSAMHSQSSRPFVPPGAPPPSPAPTKLLSVDLPRRDVQSSSPGVVVKDPLGPRGVLQENQMVRTVQQSGQNQAFAAAAALSKLVPRASGEGLNGDPKATSVKNQELRDGSECEGPGHDAERAGASGGKPQGARRTPLPGSAGETVILDVLPTASRSIADLLESRTIARRSQPDSKEEHVNSSVFSRLEKIERKVRILGRESSACDNGVSRGMSKPRKSLKGRARVWSEVEAWEVSEIPTNVRRVPARSAWDVSSLAKESADTARALAREASLWDRSRIHKQLHSVVSHAGEDARQPIEVNGIVQAHAGPLLPRLKRRRPNDA